jgi:outer membrane protein OmpA-like peptidoglycan-associated protein
MLSFAVINKYDESQILIGSRDSRGGRYTVKIRAEGDYNIEIDEAKRYAMYAENTKEKEKGKEIDITLLTEIPMLSIGQQIYLYNVNFEPFSYKLDNNMRRELDRVLVILNQNPNVIIEIGGHTDNYNPRNINLQLSEDRARAVADYLTLSGIAPERLFVKGYGDTKPIESNDTKAGRLRNRRFEITVLGYING